MSDALNIVSSIGEWRRGSHGVACHRLVGTQVDVFPAADGARVLRVLRDGEVLLSALLPADAAARLAELLAP